MKMDWFGLFWMPSWLLLTIILIFTYCTYMCKDFGVFKTMGVPGPTPLPVVGSMIANFRLGVKDTIKMWYNKYGRVFGVHEMNNPTLVVGDPEMLREILVKQFHNFTNRKIFVKAKSPVNQMVSIIKDGQWKHVRNIMTPTFSSGRLKMMTGLINHTCDKFVANLMEKAENHEDVEIKEACANFSVDVIGNTAFGIQTNSQVNPDDPLVVHARNTFKLNSFGVFLLVFLPKLVPLLNYLPSPQTKAVEYFEGLVKETLRQRQEDSEKRNDFLQLMVNAAKEAEEEAAASDGKTKNNDSHEPERKGLTFAEITAQSMMFFFGGLETTASSLAMLFYSLALHPHIAEKTLQEIDSVLGKDDCITYEQMRELNYLEQVICESQRLYPPAARIDRICSETTTIKGITIPKDMIITIPIEAIHYDKEFWPDPEKFDPDRFRAEVKADISPFKYMPFGYGPRNCIAMRLALLEMKMAAARVLQKLRPVRVERTKDNPEFSKLGFLTIKGGSWIGLEKRE